MRALRLDTLYKELYVETIIAAITLTGVEIQKANLKHKSAFRSIMIREEIPNPQGLLTADIWVGEINYEIEIKIRPSITVCTIYEHIGHITQAYTATAYTIGSLMQIWDKLKNHYIKYMHQMDEARKQGIDEVAESFIELLANKVYELLTNKEFVNLFDPARYELIRRYYEDQRAIFLIEVSHFRQGGDIEIIINVDDRELKFMYQSTNRFINIKECDTWISSEKLTREVQRSVDSFILEVSRHPYMQVDYYISEAFVSYCNSKPDKKVKLQTSDAYSVRHYVSPLSKFSN